MSIVLRGYEGEIDAYRDAHQWKDAVSASAEMAKLYPNEPCGTADAMRISSRIRARPSRG